MQRTNSEYGSPYLATHHFPFPLSLSPFWPCIDSNTTDTFKSQKGSKDIIKIIHVTSVVLFYEATRILCAQNKTKITTLFNNLFSSMSVFNVHSRKYHACVYLHVLHLVYKHATWTILMMSLLSFWALNVSVALLSIQGQKALRFPQKYLHLCSEDEWRSYGFGTTWGE